MLLLERRRFIQSPFTSESELESVLLENYEYIFGPDSVLLPKKLIRSPDGAGTIPDAFALDLQQRKWYLVEAELLGHGVWAHIAPQVEVVAFYWTVLAPDIVNPGREEQGSVSV
jgi:hypothetical protein